MHVLRSSRFLGVLISILLGLILLVPGAFAITTEDFPVARPESHVVDSAEVLSRVSRSQIEGRLLVTLPSDHWLIHCRTASALQKGVR